MNKYFALVSLGLLVALSGCVLSLHPLYTDEDLVFDTALIGEWSEKDSKETWTFTTSGEKGYNLVYVDKEGKAGEFVVHLVKVEGRLFLDLFPEEADLEANDFYKGHLLPVHTFMRIEQIESTFRIAPLDLNWIDKFLEEHPEAIRHETVEDAIVLTAKPKELQAFLIKHLETKGAFGDVINLIRKAKQ